jgi:hypothetical protein
MHFIIYHYILILFLHVSAYYTPSSGSFAPRSNDFLYCCAILISYFNSTYTIFIVQPIRLTLAAVIMQYNKNCCCGTLCFFMFLILIRSSQMMACKMPKHVAVMLIYWYMIRCIWWYCVWKAISKMHGINDVTVYFNYPLQYEQNKYVKNIMYYKIRKFNKDDATLHVTTSWRWFYESKTQNRLQKIQKGFRQGFFFTDFRWSN